MQQVTSGVGEADGCHRDLGLWAVDSANANAWVGFRNYLGCTAADVLLGQEAKLHAADDLASAEASMQTAKWKGHIHQCACGQRGGALAGAAVAVRQHMGMSHACGDGDALLAHGFQL